MILTYKYPNKTNPNIYKTEFKDIIDEPNQIQLCSDASKSINNIAMALVPNSDGRKFKIHSSNSIFTAKGLAIYKAVELAGEYNSAKTIVVTDSLSVLIQLKTSLRLLLYPI